MTAWVDLHLHSSCSDGTETPTELVARAVSSGAAAIALTDHDTVKGVHEAQEAADAAGLGFLTGTEISAGFDGREIHIVGLGINVKENALTSLLDELVEMRRNRIQTICKRLRAVGVLAETPTSWEEDNTVSIGRMHVAVTLYKTGKSRTVQQAFDRYLNRGCPAYVPKQLPPAGKVIEGIHAAGGLAFIAHPGLGRWLLKKMPQLLTLPFDGLEAWHPSHTPSILKQIIAIAKERNLLLSGGSDCHGNVKGEGVSLGRIKTPALFFHHICETLAGGATPEKGFSVIPEQK
ncbi:MAG: PHP domain-containing protein [Candidatus Hydrogenedentes bacterium]|nr:PHP domain-containing protein [Candidatus Hydrogenedentota bacterium]